MLWLCHTTCLCLQFYNAIPIHIIHHYYTIISLAAVWSLINMLYIALYYIDKVTAQAQVACRGRRPYIPHSPEPYLPGLIHNKLISLENSLNFVRMSWHWFFLDPFVVN